MVISMTLRIPAKVLIHVWSYDFYDTTLSTGKQRHNIITAYYILTVEEELLFSVCLCFVKKKKVLNRKKICFFFGEYQIYFIL